MEDNNQYEKEQKQLFEYYLDTELFPLPEKFNEMNIMKNNLEFIIRPECNQKCEYCYIYQHGSELYPLRLDKKETLNNLDIMLDYIFNIRKNYCYELELFAGDMFYDGIFFDILDIFEKYFNILNEKYSYIFQKTTTIIIPSNLHWVVDIPEYIDKFLEYQERFMNKFSTKIVFSWSTDGLYAVSSREKENLSQEYFDKIIDFCIKTNSGCHPMLSADSIETWENGNYDWWLNLYKKYNNKEDWQPMILEVRNDNWTDEKINSYLEFLTYAFYKRLEMNDNDIDKMAYHLCVGDGKNGTLIKPVNYDFLNPFVLLTSSENLKNEKVSCSMQSQVIINLTNLSTVICHRLSYDLFTAAYFVLDEDKKQIVDINVNNVDAYISIRSLKDINRAGCASCEINKICLKGCFGAQYEYTGDLMLECTTVCNLFKRKFYHLIKLLNNTGVMQSIISHNYLKNSELKSLFVNKSIEMGYSINE